MKIRTGERLDLPFLPTTRICFGAEVFGCPPFAGSSLSVPLLYFTARSKNEVSTKVVPAP